MKVILFILIFDYKEHMKKIVKVIVFIVGFCCFMVLVSLLIPDPFGRAYQRAIVYQYDYYKSLKGNKIVFVGNSSLSFGFDLNTMEVLTGKQCAILGNHAGYGMPFVMEMSKCNLEAGDIVVLELIEKKSLDACGEDLLLTGIGHRYEMYRFFIPQVRSKIVSYYPSYLKEIMMYDLNSGYSATGAYSMDSYDERGNMVSDRLECVIPDPYTEEVAKKYQYAIFSGKEWDSKYVKYINEYIEYCKSKNVGVYITLPCYYEKAVISTNEQINEFDKMLERSFNAPIISKQSEYFFGREFIYNAIAHCNSIGAIYRTNLLYLDLINANAL